MKYVELVAVVCLGLVAYGENSKQSNRLEDGGPRHERR